MAKEASNKIALILSGGGIRGIAHVGLLRAMQEFDLRADEVSGASIGALVGALYSNGNPCEEILNFFKETPLFRPNNFAFNKAGLFDTDKYYKVLQSYLGHSSFEALKSKLYVIATELGEGREVVFKEGELIRPLLASAALPPVFSPVEIDQKIYADGGILNNFPLEYVRKKSLKIGSNTTVINSLQKKDISNAIQLTTRVSSIMIHSSTAKKLDGCDIYIAPKELRSIGLLDKTAIEKAYNIGYEHGCKAIEAYLRAND